ncbi:MAG: phage antirepressor [Turicibacter sp.]|nr:phage antirepressor [Turicibacter sp.]
MTDLKVFNYHDRKIRIVIKGGEPWLVGKDVAMVLGYQNPRDALTKHVDEEDKGVAKCDTPGGKQDLAIINESGLYSLIISSKLPTAKQFKRWVTSEVLPTIRKHGGYLTSQTIEEVLSDPNTIIRLATDLITERERNNKLLSANEVLTPKGEYYDSLVETKNLTTIRQTAVQLKIPEKKFISFLLDRSYLYRDRNEKLTPYTLQVQRGYFELKDWTQNGKSGVIAMVTTKGKKHLRNILLANGLISK